MDFFELILRNKPDNNRLNHDGNIYDPFNVLRYLGREEAPYTLALRRCIYIFRLFNFTDFELCSCIEELMWIRVDPMWVLFSSTTPSG